MKKYSGECGGTFHTRGKFITPPFPRIIYSAALLVSHQPFGFIAVLPADECSHAQSSPVQRYLRRGATFGN